jgi:hypothetical protein
MDFLSSARDNAIGSVKKEPTRFETDLASYGPQNLPTEGPKIMHSFVEILGEGLRPSS